MRRFMVISSLLLSLCLSAAQAEQAKKEEKLLSNKEAVAIAEKFVAAQGYTDTGSNITLQPKSVGARLDSDIWFVGFRSTIGDNIRGIAVDAKDKSARLLSQNLKLDWLNAADAEKPAAADKPTAPEKAPKAKPAPAKKAPAKATPSPTKKAPVPAKLAAPPAKKKAPAKTKPAPAK